MSFHHGDKNLFQGIAATCAEMRLQTDPGCERESRRGLFDQPVMAIPLGRQWTGARERTDDSRHEDIPVPKVKKHSNVFLRKRMDAILNALISHGGWMTVSDLAVVTESPFNVGETVGCINREGHHVIEKIKDHGMKYRLKKDIDETTTTA